MEYDSTQDDRLWAMLAYLLTFVAPIVAPLVIFLVKKDTSRFVGFHALQSLLIELAVIVVGVAAFILSLLLAFLGPAAILAIPLWIAVWVAGLAAFVLTIVAAIKAFAGEWYVVPFIGSFARNYTRV